MSRARLDEAQHDVVLATGHVEQLAEAHRSGEIGEGINRQLAELHARRLTTTEQALHDARAELEAWRTDGPAAVSNPVPSRTASRPSARQASTLRRPLRNARHVSPATP